MTGAVYLIFYFLTILTAGFAVVSLIFNGKKRSLVETLSLTMLLGTGTVSIVFFWFTLIGLKPSRTIIFAIFAVSLGIVIFLGKKKKTAPLIIPEKLTTNEWICFSLVGLVLLFMFGIVTAHSLTMPLYDIDAYALWGLKSKALYHEGLIKDGLFYQLPLSYSHLNYPLMVPFLVTGVYVSIGQVHDLIGKIIFPFFYLGMAGFIFTSLRWKLRRIPALLLTVMFMSLPAMIRWVGAGKADFPVAIFHALSVFYLIKFIKEEKTPDLILAMLTTVFCAFIKNEGIAMAMINIGVFGLFYVLKPFSVNKLKTAIIFAAGIGILMIPWFFWAHGIPRTHENYPQRIFYILKGENLHRIKEVLVFFSGVPRKIKVEGLNEQYLIVQSSGFLNMGRWSILWIMLPIVVLLNYIRCKQRYVLAMWTLLFLQIAVYFYVFIISPWDPKSLADMALERIFLHASPLAIYLIAFHLKEEKEREVNLETEEDAVEGKQRRKWNILFLKSGLP